MKILPLITIWQIVATVSIVTAQQCDLPSPENPTQISPIQLPNGAIFRYPYSKLTAVGDSGDIVAHGYRIIIEAEVGGSFTTKVYADLQGKELVVESDTEIDANETRARNRRLLFCGGQSGPSSEIGLIEIEVTSGTLTLFDLYAIEAYGGDLYYSTFEPSLLDVSTQPADISLKDEEIEISLERPIFGTTYYIEISSDLSNWIKQNGTEQLSTGRPLTWIFSTPKTDQNFYRIKESN